MGSGILITIFFLPSLPLLSLFSFIQTDSQFWGTVCDPRVDVDPLSGSRDPIHNSIPRPNRVLMIYPRRRDPLKVPCQMEIDVDYISNLPEHITDKILSCLSLRDAVRTSILSRKWRYKWISLPHLIFDNESLLISSQDPMLIRQKLINIVDHVLLLHSGPIQKFKLSHRDLQGVYDIDRWILFLSRGSVKEFILEIYEDHRYKLPASLYFCQKLINLEIFNCLVKPPSTFDGFKNLKSLDLQHITMDQDVFDNLISSCTLLERLTLMNFVGFFQLNIHAPYLLFFHIGGVFEDVNFDTTNNLAIVYISLYTTAVDDQNPPLGSTGNMIKFFAPLPRIQRLGMHSFFLKYLAAGKVPERLPTPCIELNYLSLRINFNDWAECMAALCILRSSPNLQELEILNHPDEQAADGTDAHILEECFRNCPFNQLQLVKMVGISYAKQELNFVKFLLANSPVLEKMTIKPVSANGGCELLKELVRFRRASVLAEIIFLDP